MILTIEFDPDSVVTNRHAKISGSVVIQFENHCLGIQTDTHTHRVNWSTWTSGRQWLLIIIYGHEALVIRIMVGGKHSKTVVYSRFKRNNNVAVSCYNPRRQGIGFLPPIVCLSAR